VAKQYQRAGRRFVVTARDLSLFKLIYQNRFADSKAIKAKFWPGSANKNYYRRLKLLIDRGYLTRLRGDSGFSLGYQLTRKALKTLRQDGTKLLGTVRTKPLYTTSYRHDKCLIRLREVFESSPLITHYVPEHELRAALARRHGMQEKRDERYKVPDGIFQLRTHKGGFTVALELELAIKSTTRYARMMKQLCISEDFTVIFFVGENVQILNILEQHLAQVRTTDRLVKMWKPRHAFYFALLSDFLELKLKAPIKGEGAVLVLDDVARNMGVSPPKNESQPETRVLTLEKEKPNSYRR